MTDTVFERMPTDNPLGSEMIDSVVERLNTWTADDFHLKTLIGQGAFGRVYQAVEKKTSKVYAIKIMSKHRIDKANFGVQIRRELDLHGHLKHPNVLHCHASFETEKFIYIVVDYCPNGSLAQLISKSGKLEESSAARYTRDIASGLLYCHDKNILHRDVKPENLLITTNDRIIICDFGHAIASTEPRVTTAGTLDFISPEMARETFYTKETDIWALGVVIVEMITGHPPFEDQDISLTLELIKEANFSLPQYVSRNARHLICSILVKEPSKRMPLADVIQHQWINSHCGMAASSSKEITNIPIIKTEPAKSMSMVEKAKVMLKKYDIQ